MEQDGRMKFIQYRAMNNREQTILQQRQQESLVPIIKDKPNYIRPTSFADACTKSRTTLLSVCMQRGLPSLVGWVKGKLIELFTYLGVFDIVTEYQVQMLAARICAKYHYWTTTELDYAFVTIMDGKYGKLFQHKHDDNNTTINPQDIIEALNKYEQDMLAERGRQDDERRRADEIRKAAEEAKKPLGLEGWKVYCEKNGLDPATHRIQSVDMSQHDVNQVLYKTEEERKMAERKFYRQDRRKEQK